VAIVRARSGNKGDVSEPSAHNCDRARVAEVGRLSSGGCADARAFMHMQGMFVVRARLSARPVMLDTNEGNGMRACDVRRLHSYVQSAARNYARCLL